MSRCRWGHRKVAALVVGLATAAVACSDVDSGGSSNRQVYVDAFVDAAQEGGSTDDQQDRCFAESAVDAVGVANLREAGVSPDDVRESSGGSPADHGVEVTDDQGADYYERLQDCLDVRQYLVNAVVDSGVVTDESYRCLEEAFDDNLARQIVISEFVQGREAGTSAVAEEIDAVYARCSPGPQPPPGG